MAVKHMKQEIRIIGGQYRGKKLHFPAVEGLRPTPNRIRETLFNWLMHDIKGARCLDAFAGSGALGFEAFSRGASQVVFLENSCKVHTHLEKIIRSFNNSILKLIQTDTREYLQTSKEHFDIIFLDPPFALNYLPQCIEYLSKNNLLVSGGLIYVESATEINLNELQWQQIKLKKAGQVFYGLFKRIITNE
jgi:16S rRNA (guanine966-N2)-methyltransferase